jgi:sn-glycerol 3-phosphate transport system ATP-binding protein/multiple sugar transport system ATP-binding protein
MGRAIVRRAQLFLFDEPLSNLDAALRAQVRVDIRKLHDRLGATSVYVTHDQVEAMTLADVIFVLNKGVVEQSGPPLEVFAQPRTRFVAGFLGSPAMNFFDARMESRDGRWFAVQGDLALEIDAAAFPGALASGRKVTVGVRPHEVEIATGDEGAPFQVSIVEALGAESYAHGTVGGAPFVARMDPEARVAKGDTLRIAPRNIHLFDADTGETLRAA